MQVREDRRSIRVLEGGIAMLAQAPKGGTKRIADGVGTVEEAPRTLALQHLRGREGAVVSTCMQGRGARGRRGTPRHGRELVIHIHSHIHIHLDTAGARLRQIARLARLRLQPRLCRRSAQVRLECNHIEGTLH